MQLFNIQIHPLVSPSTLSMVVLIISGNLKHSSLYHSTVHYESERPSVRTGGTVQYETTDHCSRDHHQNFLCMTIFHTIIPISMNWTVSNTVFHSLVISRMAGYLPNSDNQLLLKYTRTKHSNPPTICAAGVFLTAPTLTTTASLPNHLLHLHQLPSPDNEYDLSFTLPYRHVP